MDHSKFQRDEFKWGDFNRKNHENRQGRTQVTIA